MRKTFLLGAFAFWASTGAAQAGIIVPGPEIGDGYAGLVVLALVLAGYLVVRQMRIRKV